MIPTCLKVGTILTVTSFTDSRCADVTAASPHWTEPVPHRHGAMQVPRPVVSLRSKYAEIGPEKSILNYPKKAELIQDGPDELIIQWQYENGNACVRTRITYLVNQPGQTLTPAGSP